MNHKRVYGLYREDGLGLRLRRPRRNVSAANRERQPATAAPNEMWSMDFVSDGLFRDQVSPRRKKKVDNGITLRSDNLIDYLTFGELSQITTDNWELFEPVFNSESAVSMSRIA